MSRDIPVFSRGNEIDGLKESLLQCQQQLDRSNAKILAREKRIKELREEITSKDMQLENRKEELTAQVEDNEKMQTKLQGLKAQDGEIEALRSTIEELRTTIQNLQDDRLAARRQEAQQNEAENIRNLEELRGRIQPAMNIVRFVDCLIRDINNPGLLKDIKRSRQIEGEFTTHRLSLAFPIPYSEPTRLLESYFFGFKCKPPTTISPLTVSENTDTKVGVSRATSSRATPNPATNNRDNAQELQEGQNASRQERESNETKLFASRALTSPGNGLSIKSDANKKRPLEESSDPAIQNKRPNLKGGKKAIQSTQKQSSEPNEKDTTCGYWRGGNCWYSFRQERCPHGVHYEIEEPARKYLHPSSILLDTNTFLLASKRDATETPGKGSR